MYTVKVTSLEARLLTEECKCINWNVAANVSLCCITHQHCLNRYDFNLCLKTGRLREGSLKSVWQIVPDGGPRRKRSFVAQSFLFLFSAHGDHLAPSSE